MSEHEARPAMEAWIERAMARAQAPVADDGDGWETTAAVLASEVERLRTELERNQSIYEGAIEQTVDMWRVRCDNARRGRGEAMERATKAEQMLADVRELAGEWRAEPTRSIGTTYASIAAHILALLPDETGDDRG